MQALNAEHLAPSHSRSISGAANVNAALTAYRDGIKSILDQTLDGMRKGERPDMVDKAVRPDVLLPAHGSATGFAFYTGKMFPKEYQGGAFIALHGSWNRAPEPQGGYNVTFQPLSNGKAAGDFEIFAGGFAGKTPLMNPGDALARPDGIATAPDGSMYISDSQRGRVWRVLYRGGK